MKKIKTYFKKKLEEAELEFSDNDFKRILDGKKPAWAKSNKEVPAKERKVAGSDSHVERAMRAVTATDKFAEPYRESDFRRDRAANIKLNQDILDKISAKIPSDKKYANENFACIIVGDYEYRIFHRGMSYSIHKMPTDSIFNREYENVKNIADVIRYIQKDM